MNKKNSKKKLATKMLTKKEKLDNEPPFTSKYWKNSKEQIKEKVKNRVDKVKKRKEEREADPKTVKKIKKKRLKKIAINKLRLEKKRAKNLKYEQRIKAKKI